MKTQIELVLNSQISIPKDDFDDLMQRIKEVLHILKKVKYFTLPDLYDDDWLSKSVYERIILGKTMAHMVDEDLVPFDFADYTCITPKRYRYNNSH